MQVLFYFYWNMLCFRSLHRCWCILIDNIFHIECACIFVLDLFVCVCLWFCASSIVYLAIWICIFHSMGSLNWMSSLKSVFKFQRKKNISMLFVHTWGWCIVKRCQKLLCGRQFHVLCECPEEMEIKQKLSS